MDRRAATLTLLAFVVGLVAGAALLLEGGGSPLSTSRPGPAPDARLATAGVALEVVNRGSQPADVALEVRDRAGTVVFESSFSVAPSATVTRNIVSLVEGDYEARATVRGSVGSARFQTTDCAGRVYLGFEVTVDRSGARVGSPAEWCG